MHYAFDYDSDGHERTEKPATPFEDLDEEQRQKTLIATHLNLTLEEYERLDAAFGNTSQPSHASEDERSMTERYQQEFLEFDVDNSGSISPDELRQLLLASGEDMDDAELASVIQQADTDHDGEINFHEFIALMRARKRLLCVANHMGVTGSGPTSMDSTASPGNGFARNAGQVLPPLKLAARQAKRHLQPQHRSLVAARSTPSCLRPGAKVDIGDLRRELALSEYGIQELNSKVREGLQWVQQHCPVRSLKAQIFCHRWGMEKVHQLFLRLQSQHISRAFRKWNAFLMFERNKIKANMFLKCKGSQKMTAIMNSALYGAISHGGSENVVQLVDCKNAVLRFFNDKQRRVEAQKLERFQRLTSAVVIQSLFRGYLARRRAQRARYEKLKWMNFTLMNTSALKIQAFWRGYHGRLASHLRLQAQKAQQHQEIEAAKRIQVITRGKLARDKRRRLEQERAKLASQQRTRVRAALRIQKVFRGKQARKMVQELQLKHREEARVALERLVHQTKTRAATKVQCCARRFLARCHYLHQRQEMEKRKQQEELRITQNHAALVIQCAIRRAGARRVLLQRRREFEKRISMMASEKAHDEIERLRQEQEEELLKLKMQLMFQASSANEEAAKLREELARQREEEEARRKEEAQELARLRLETLMQQHEIDTRVEQDKQKKLEAQRLRERLEAEKQAQQEKEAAMRTQENEELAVMKLASMLPTKQEEQEKIDRTLQQEAEHLKQAALAIQKDQARMKIQALCLKHVARKRLAKLQQAQSAAMASIQDEEQRLRLQAEQQKELALARLKVMMDDEARAREQEIKELEVQMLERARKEKERIALRNSSARKIQSRARGYLARQRVKAIQHKIEKEREDRAKAMQETIEAAEAEVAEALIEAGEDKPDAAEGSEETKADEWVEYWDENAQASYFYNIRTQEASWTRPVSTPSAKVVESVMEATGLPEEREQDAASGYVDYAVTGQVDANGFPVPAATAESYADEYGYYDQYGQYHYYEQNNAAYYGAPAYGQGYPQMMGVQPNYAAAAAANYAYQAAAAMAFGQAMMYGAPGMGYGNPAMVQPVQQYPQAPADEPPAETENAGEAVPPDPWEKFYDQYTGAAYYYNNITGEQYWA
ncbi:hypothetical protein JG687_00005016 [Phytophthora cactorum]|uniref:Calmodulin n=1 Tax=Phytophthora cactorum TaxID=29920 RepID=A0A8T1UPZ7_9STRA|nr:hypothetical protein JG687_00005016 [Phytophthora cactorum]